MESITNQRKILIVDDEECVLQTLRRIVESIQRQCLLASSAEEARRIMKKEAFDIILCDINLPGESGLDFFRHVISEYPETAVIMVSAEDNPDVAENALKLGAYGYIVKPFKPSEVIINVSSAILRQMLEVERRIYRENLEQTVVRRTAKLQENLDEIIQTVALIVGTRDPYTAGHQRRVAELTCAIAEEMGYSEDQVKGLRMAGVIHDLGKISVPAEILSKPGRLSDMEFAIIKGHPQVGYDTLKGIDFPWPIAQIVLQHHERMNGSGYPRRLKGKEILPEARILGVADVVEAMASHRPYRPALGIEVALEEVQKNRGTIYDPEVVDTCVRVFQEKKFEFSRQ